MGGPYTLGDGKLFYKSTEVADGVSMAAGYLYGSGSGSYYVDYVQKGIAKTASAASYQESFTVVPASATPLGYGYYFDHAGKTLHYRNAFVASGVTSATSWLVAGGWELAAVTFISNGVAHTANSATPDLQTYSIPSLTEESQALAGEYILTKPEGELYIGSSLVRIDEEIGAAAVYLDAIDNRYYANIVQHGLASFLVANPDGSVSKNVSFQRYPSSTIPLGFRFYFDPASRSLWYAQHLVSSNVINARAWLTSFYGNTYVATYMMDTSSRDHSATRGSPDGKGAAVRRGDIGSGPREFRDLGDPVRENLSSMTAEPHASFIGQSRVHGSAIGVVAWGESR